MWFTGGGVQAMKFLREPVTLGTGGVAHEEFEEANVAWANARGGDKCHDCSHRSRMDKRNLPDALTLMRPLFTVDEKGRVITKGGDTGEPAGLSPDEFVSSRLTSLRGHWFPASIGGGATGGGTNFAATGDTSAFDPRSPNYSITRQFQLEAERGTKWADAARRKYGGGR